MIDDPLLPFAEGHIIANKYRVERLLGAGSFGVVVAARHIELDDDVAIKVLRCTKVEDPAVVERLIREARVAARLKGEHVVRVFDVGKLEDGAPYIVMERLVGTDLEWLFAERGSLPIVEAVGYVLQACEAVAEAHALGMVHRDLKLSNLFLTTRPDGSSLIKVLDFGIAKWTAANEPDAKRLTGDGIGLGTPLYMSPEQLKDARTADDRSDVWSLGVILHQLVAGSPPFDAETTTGVIAAVLTAEPPPLCSVVPTAPKELERVVLKCLEKDPELRTGSIHEFARALEAFSSEDDRASIRRVARLQATAATRIGFPSLPDILQDATAASARAGPPSALGTQHAAAISDGEGSLDEIAGIPRRSSKWTYALAALVLVGIGASAVFVAARSRAVATAGPTISDATAGPRVPIAPASLQSETVTVPPPETEPGVDAGVVPTPTPTVAASMEAVTTRARPRKAAESNSPKRTAPAAPAAPAHHTAPTPNSEKHDDPRSLIDSRR